MQKQLKLLDKELKSNDLVRIQDITHKHQNSLFRALSMAVYFSHNYGGEVIREMKLTLISNLSDKRSNAYPIINQSAILKKYQSHPELILDYWDQPDLNCFHNDTLIIASAAFCKSVTVLFLDRDEYLNETYISACKNPDKDRIMLAKAGKKYYAVLKTSTFQVISDLREIVIGQLLETLFEETLASKQPREREDKIHYPNYDEVITGNHRHSRQHKKSLSDCGDLPIQTQVIFQDRKKQYAQNSDRSFNLNSGKVYDRLQQQFFDSNNSYVNQGYNQLEAGLTEQQLLQGNYKNYYGYNYPSYVLPTEQNYFPYVEPQSPVNNQRYTGRLKFFDQSGNYGFIVIDSLNSDLFVHFDDLSRAGLSKEKLLSLKNNFELRFEFTYYEYEGKQHRKSKKAIDLVIIANDSP